MSENSEKIDPRLIPEVNIGMLGHVAHGKCLDPEEPILLNNHVVTGRELLKNVEVRNEVFMESDRISVYSLDAHAKMVRALGKRYAEKYSGYLIEVVTKYGRRVRVTPNHLFLVNENGVPKWKKASDLKKADEIFVLGRFEPKENLEKVKKEIDFESVLKEFIMKREREWFYVKFKNGKIAKIKPFKIDEDFMKLLAFINAEGTIGRSRISLTQKEEIGLLKEILRYLKSLGYHIRRYKITYTVSPAIIAKYFKRIVGSQKNLRNWFLYLPKELKRVYLRWFFSLDGTINLKSRELELVQSSEELTNYLLLLFYQFEIFPTIVEKRVKGKKYYRLLLSGTDAIKFLEEIGLVGKKKRKAELLLKLLKNSKSKVKTYRSISLDRKEMIKLTEILRNEKKIKDKGMKKLKIYKAWEEARKKGKITEELLRRTLKIVKEKAKTLVESNERELLEILPIRRVARIFGIAPTTFRRKIKAGDPEALELLKSYANSLAEESLKLCEKIERLFLGNLRCEEVKEINRLKVKDKTIFDLNVPRFHAFFGGRGFILLHNTTLTLAITGKLTLQHSEELKRGITIRLGYADATIYKCSKCGKYSTSPKCPYCFSDTEPQRTISIVDAPGHETLMATVLTGAGIMDGAILVIAANEPCPKPQTLEHLKALEIVGIKNIVIVQNKIDLVTKERALENYKEIREFVKGTIAENAPIIPISAQQKINIDKVLEAIQKHIPTPKRDPKAKPKMLVARSFDVNKPGRTKEKLLGGILGGSIIQGEFHVGDEVEIKPGIKINGKYTTLKTKIVGLQKAKKNLEKAGPGGLVGMATTLDPALTKSDKMVGNLVSLPGVLPDPVWKIGLEANMLERVVGSEEIKSMPPLKVGEKLLINVATQRTLGIVKKIKGKYVEVDLRIPLVIERGEKIVLSRQIGGRWRLVGYGIVEEV